MSVKPVDNTLRENLIIWRRALHEYPELGWTEIKTAAYIALILKERNINFVIGEPLFAKENRMGLPDTKTLDNAFQRATENGADRKYAEKVRGGYTGIMASFGSGKPEIGLRFDIDALPIQESSKQGHLPHDLGFASKNAGIMHACGHDFHAAIGLGLCEILAARAPTLQGTVHVIFQPAEEGVRGANAMVKAGIADTLDYVLCQHNRTNWKTGEIACGILGYQATTKFDVNIRGQAAHAGGSPHEGNNAIQAAAAAVQALYGIPRHSGGTTRINVGTLHGGSGRNIIADRAEMAVETRGATSELERYMYKAAIRAIEHTAAMYGCSVTTNIVGSAPSATSTHKLIALAENVASNQYGWLVHQPSAQLGSEDFTYFMNQVQSHGGEATHISIGAGIPGVSLNAHTSTYDADEHYMAPAVSYLAALIMAIIEADDT